MSTIRDMANSARDMANSAKAVLGRAADLATKPAQWNSSDANGAKSFNPTKFNASDNKYDIKSFMYPSDLMSATNTYGGNYAMFYINVNVDPKLVKDMDQNMFADDVPNRKRGALVAQNLSVNQLVGGMAVTNTLTGLVTGKAIKDVAKTTVLANVPTVGAGVVAAIAPSTTRFQKRLKTAIALHIPNQLSVKYGASWGEEDTLAASMGGAAAQQAGEMVKALEGKNNNSDVKGLGASVIANLTLSKAPGAAGISAATGLASNPRKEQIFKGVSFRSFSFEYQFFPRSAEEAKNVMNIIQIFKYHMHPEFKDANSFVYIYPSEFDISYFTNGVENPHLHRHTSCVLEELNVNYTPNGTFTSFDNGMPTQINMTMQFKEIALLDKSTIKEGL